MSLRASTVVALTLALHGCAERWPDPPAIDQAEYAKAHQSWRDEQRSQLSSILQITGIWPLADGETAFGADRGLPIVLPAEHFPQRAGVFRRTGTAVTVVPAARDVLTRDDGSPLNEAAEVDAVSAGPIRLQLTDAGDDRRWVAALDTAHPAVANPPVLESYPLDPQWRAAARFEAFGQPRTVRVPDVRGGFMEFTAVGQLVFRVRDQEMRLTAFGEEESARLFVMFKDPTNQSTTYNGYRIVTPEAVKDGEWTVLDFNFASNPPCAYSRYTTCPLPPPENRLTVPIEAGLKRLPSAQGFTAG
jgi:uncharacterized protein (DUF1684 family)